jgi:hypothetical protein
VKSSSQTMVLTVVEKEGQMEWGDTQLATWTDPATGKRYMLCFEEKGQQGFSRWAHWVCETEHIYPVSDKWKEGGYSEEEYVEIYDTTPQFPAIREGFVYRYTPVTPCNDQRVFVRFDGVEPVAPAPVAPAPVVPAPKKKAAPVVSAGKSKKQEASVSVPKKAAPVASSDEAGPSVLKKAKTSHAKVPPAADDHAGDRRRMSERQK